VPSTRKAFAFYLSVFAVTKLFAADAFFPSQFTLPKEYTLRAYSEFMPAPRLGVRPYEVLLSTREEILAEPYWSAVRADAHTFRIDATEEKEVLRPSLQYLSEHLLDDLAQLAAGKTAGGSQLKGIPAALLNENPHWYGELPKLRGPWVVLSTWVLSKTQDDQGRTPWTLQTVGEEERAFWRSHPENAPEWWRTFLTQVLEKPVTDLDSESFGIYTKEKLPPLLERWSVKPGDAVKILVTFAPLTGEWRKNYLSGKLIVLPHPLTRLFAGSPVYSELAKKYPEAKGFAWMQALSQFAAFPKLRVPRVRPFSTDEKWSRRRHRFSQNANALGEDLSSPAVSPFEGLFDPISDVIGLYGKPTARNAQVWGISGPLAGRFILDGPSANEAIITEARARIVSDRDRSRLQVRDVYPSMEINDQPVEWHRPWVAWRNSKGETVTDFSLSGRVLVGETPLSLSVSLTPPPRELLPPKIVPLTFSHTVEREAAFEKRYWEKLVDLTKKELSAKNNVDCAEHEAKDEHCGRNQLPQLNTEVLTPHYRTFGLDLMEHAFRWEMDFKIPWWGGLTQKQKNLIVVIPGTGDHSEAVWMADHYDTAYMEDIYEGNVDPDLAGHRHASAGADDNASATAALMEAARVLSKLRLKRDVWLVHLTGEEFPADCLGARALAEALVKQKPILKNQPNPKVVGVYVLDMIAHNTNRDSVGKGAIAPSIFQISPGRGNRAERLAELAWGSAKAWNARAKNWSQTHGRKQLWERSSTTKPPRQGEFPIFDAQIRRPDHPSSTLYNTDGQIFSDAGIPVVLFMENYDINRVGYHDTKDTLENIDLDYGAGVARIAIEAVAQAANADQM